MITFGRALGSPPPAGTYRKITEGSKEAAVITCPNCGDRNKVDTGWINEHGSVEGIVSCGNDACDFSSDIVLEHWDAPW